ncbi:hypothetical protein D3C73_943290 [compost metagenome]
MERKQANPARRMNRIGMGMVTLFSHVVGNIMDGDDSVEQNQEDKNEHAQREII